MNGDDVRRELDDGDADARRASAPTRTACGSPCSTRCAKATPQDDQRALQLLDNVAKSNPGSPAVKQLAVGAAGADRRTAARRARRAAEGGCRNPEARGAARDGARACCAIAFAAAAAAGAVAGRRAAAAAAVAAAAGAVGAVARRSCMQTGDILLVDDDPDLLKLISLRLTSAGYRVRTADSGEAALAALAVARPGAVDHRSAHAGHRRPAAVRGHPPRSIRRCP